MTAKELRELLLPMLEFLRQRWAEWAHEANKPENAAGKNMCRFTAAFLTATLGAPWRATGGGCFYNAHSDEVISVGGFYDGTAWQAHYWVTDGERIVDLTASQFGAEPVLVTPMHDPRYDANFPEQECRQALAGVRTRARQWADDYSLCLRAEALLAAE